MSNLNRMTAPMDPNTIETNQEPIQVEVPSSLEGVGVVPTKTAEVGENTQTPKIASGASAIAQANIPVSETLVSQKDLDDPVTETTFSGLVKEKSEGAVPFGYSFCNN
ncbi:hypothetical protein K8R14_00160 [bacterium]|nr:hypothetical protein [bacterium]